MRKSIYQMLSAFTLGTVFGWWLLWSVAFYVTMHNRKYQNGQQVVMICRNGNLGVVNNYSCGNYTIHYPDSLGVVHSIECKQQELCSLSDDSLTTK